MTDVVKLVSVELLRVIFLVPVYHSFIHRHLNAVIETVMHSIPKVALVNVFEAIGSKYMQKPIQHSRILVITLSLITHLHRFEGKV